MSPLFAGILHETQIVKQAHSSMPTIAAQGHWKTSVRLSLMPFWGVMRESSGCRQSGRDAHTNTDHISQRQAKSPRALAFIFTVYV